MKMLRLLAALTATVLIINSVPVLADGEGNEFVENSDEIVEVADEDAELSAGYAGTGSVEINDTNFPDPIFRNYITEKFDRVRDDILSPSEILAITSIDVGSKGVSNLAGIQYFTALEELNCWNNYLSSIDLSNNTALKKLDCSHNDLTTIDVSYNTALKHLDCAFNDLTSLDVSHNTALTVLYCHSNNLTTLDVSANSSLMFFYCHDNSLTNLDLSNNTALKKLMCFGNDFTILEISNNPVLINVYNNGTHRTEYGSEIYEIADGPIASQGLLRFDIGGIIIIDTPAPRGSVNMYRLYNPNSGEHFYTSNAIERNMLIIAGWNYEGVGWVAPTSSNTPVYRLYNQYGGEHHYTTSIEERNMLINAGWNDEDIGWYSDDARTVPLYRQYNPNEFANNHNYTSSQSENDYLVSIGWRAEGIGWYGVG